MTSRGRVAWLEANISQCMHPFKVHVEDTEDGNVPAAVGITGIASTATTTTVTHHLQSTDVVQALQVRKILSG